MESENIEVKQESYLHQVTPLSKYLAMALFIAMPFVGGWIGYMYSPEKVVEVYNTQERQLESLLVATSTAPLLSLELMLDTEGNPTSFAKDGTNIYYSYLGDPSNLEGYNIINEFDGVSIDYNTFEVLAKGMYIKDKNSVFVGRWEDYLYIPNADPLTFTLLSPSGEGFDDDVFYGIAVDGKRAYSYSREFLDADVKSFEIILPKLFRDAKHIYGTEMGRPYLIKEIDAQTFSYNAERDTWSDINGSWTYDPIWGLRQVEN